MFPAISHGPRRPSSRRAWDAAHLADAWQYAEAALRGFQTYGAGAADDIQKTLDLIAEIAKAAAD